MVKTKKNENKVVELLKKIFGEKILIISIFFYSIPVIHAAYLQYSDFPLENMAVRVYLFAGIFLPVAIITAIINKKIAGLIAVLPGFLYLLFQYINQPIQNNGNMLYVIYALAAFSLFYTIAFGHVRSISFLFLIAYSLMIWKDRTGLILPLVYVFVRFIYLVIKDNYSIFAQLGFSKSIRMLIKAFFFWSPMLIFIVPISLTKSHINNELVKNIYENTLVDSCNYYTGMILDDSLIVSFRQNKNTTTILEIDSFSIVPDIISKIRIVKNDTITRNGILLNKLNSKTPFQDDSMFYATLIDGLSDEERTDTNIPNIYTNDIYLSSDKVTLNQLPDTLKSIIDWGEDSKNPCLIVLSDIALDTVIPDKTIEIDDLRQNLDISTLISFKNLEKKLTEKITSQMGEIKVQEINFENSEESLNREIDNKRNEFMKQINAHEVSTNVAVTNEYNSMFPEPLIKIKKCKWWEIKKLIKNEIYKNINKKYRAEKIKNKKKIDRKISNIYNDVRQKVNATFEETKQNITGKSQALQSNQKALLEGNQKKLSANLPEMLTGSISEVLNEIAQSLIDGYHTLFRVLFFYNLVGLFSFIFLIIQTYLYIFARIVVSKKHKVFATLNTSAKNLPKGEIKKSGDTYLISASQKQEYYISRVFEPSGRPPKFVIPYSTTSILPRLRSRTYAMNKISMKRSGTSVQFRATGSSEFVEWTLRKNEEVIFDYKNFVAMSGTVKLSSLASFRVTTPILGRIFFKVAKGPGKLVLMTAGRPVISGERMSNVSLAQNRILAWNKGTRFDIDSELSLTDVYLSGFYLKKMPSDLIIIDADAKGRAQLGLIQYIKGLIWPF